MINDVELLAAVVHAFRRCLPSGPNRDQPIPFRDRVEAAARAGYRGVAVPTHGEQDRSAGGMKRILDGNGIKHVELEFLLDCRIR